MLNRVLTVAALAAIAGTVALAQPASKESKPATGKPAGQANAQPEMQLPPGMTAEDMQACMEAGTPGPMHEYLAERVGVWEGKSKMWMAPGMEPMESTCTMTNALMMDGRFVKCKIEGEMPGMGPFNGFGITGYDNVSEEFVSTWVDNCGTGIMTGTGDLSSDKKTLNWSFTYNCPIRKAPTTMREVETHTGKDSLKLEMYGSNPKTGEEYKMMEIAFTRTSKDPNAGSPRAGASTR